MRRPCLLPWCVAVLSGLATAGLATAEVATDRAPATPSDSGAGTYRLQMPGDFHGDEPVARDGQRWLALRVDADGRARLDGARLRVLAVEDPLGDAPGQTSGRRVQADGAEALAFVRGPALRGGPVDSAQIESLDIPGLPDARLLFAGRAYRLQTDCAAFAPAAEASPGATASPRCRVVLRLGRARAVLMDATATRVHGDDGTAYTSLGDDAMPQLLFAGDLDRDGRLDLLFDTTDHYNLQRPTLFLSSAAASSAARANAAVSGDALMGAALPGAALSSQASSGPMPSTPASSSEPATPDAADADPDADEALPLRAVATYRAVGC